jgi:hypothetical protein
MEMDDATVDGRRRPLRRTGRALEQRITCHLSIGNGSAVIDVYCDDLMSLCSLYRDQPVICAGDL